MGGIVMIIAGVWVGCQILGGDALDRLGVTKPSSSLAFSATDAVKDLLPDIQSPFTPNAPKDDSGKGSSGSGGLYGKPAPSAETPKTMGTF